MKMYQIKYSDGNEIQVIGRGENGLCRVVGRNGEDKHVGTYETCVKWLADRGCHEVAGNTAAGLAEQAGR